MRTKPTIQRVHVLAQSEEVIGMGKYRVDLLAVYTVKYIIVFLFARFVSVPPKNLLAAAKI